MSHIAVDAPRFAILAVIVFLSYFLFQAFMVC